ncbi:MAG: FGGY-family carbohydrate kinase [Candidatus Thorarchaeota archaeon]
MTVEYVIGVDIGTTAHKVIIVDSKGNLISEVSNLLDPVISKYQGWAEHDTNNWYETITETTREAIKQADIPSEKIGALGIANQGRGVIAINKQGKVLRPAILWLDTRTILHKGNRLQWFRDNEPEILIETYKIIGPQAWLAYQLTGNIVDSSSSAFADEFISNTTWKWDEKLVEEANFPMELLPDLVLPGEMLGRTTEKAAKEFGLPIGLPIIAGGRDKQLGSLGAGCTESDKLMVSLGTAVTIGTTSSECRSTPIFPQKSGIPFHYDNQMGFGGGFWTLRWFIEQFCEGIDDNAAYTQLEKEAKKILPCSEGLVVLPHWWGGQWFRMQFPVWEKGAVIGWTARHTISHFYRAVIEGILHEIKTYRNKMEEIMKTEFTSIRFIGGGSKSDLVMQIAADVLGTNASRIHTSSAEALGAAIVAAKGCGMYSNVQEAVENMSRVVQTFKPNPSNQAIYDEFHNGIYVKLSATLDSINQKLFVIAGEIKEKFQK